MSKSMTQKQALAKATKLWGATAYIRDSGKKHSSSPEKRQQARAELNELKKQFPDRKQRTREQNEKANDLQYDVMHYRYAVGHIKLGMFFAVKGMGDTWAEAFEAASKS